MHHAETHIVPLGVKAGYPLNINFEAISSRIANIKDDLQKINLKVGLEISIKCL